jgi:broad specificity phosphatase PhoE
MREKGGGEYEGKPLDLFRKIAADKKIPLRKFKGKGGECWNDVNERAKKLLLTLAANHLSMPLHNNNHGK